MDNPMDLTCSHIMFPSLLTLFLLLGSPRIRTLEYRLQTKTGSSHSSAIHAISDRGAYVSYNDNQQVVKGAICHNGKHHPSSAYCIGESSFEVRLRELQNQSEVAMFFVHQG